MADPDEDRREPFHGVEMIKAFMEEPWMSVTIR